MILTKDFTAKQSVCDTQGNELHMSYMMEMLIFR